MGTAVGTEVFVKFGWRPAAALSVGWSGFTLIIMLIRGPHCARYTWFGYEGGLRLTKIRPPVQIVVQSGPAPQSNMLTVEKKDALSVSGSVTEAGGDSKHDPDEKSMV